MFLKKKFKNFNPVKQSYANIPTENDCMFHSYNLRSDLHLEVGREGTGREKGNIDYYENLIGEGRQLKYFRKTGGFSPYEREKGEGLS
jgi:hypothetical protein